MKNSFEHITNGWLYRTCKAIGDAVIISFLFLLFCLPVVTAGASVTALYYTVYRKYTKKIDNISKDFMHSLKDNLKSGIVINLIYLIYGSVVGFNIYAAFFGFGNVKLPDWYMIVSLLPLLLIIFSLPFAYPLLARFNNGIKGTIRNSFTLCMINFPKTLLLCLIILVATAVCVCFPPAVLLVPAGATRLYQMITEKAFASAMRVEKARTEDGDTGEAEEAPDNEENEEAISEEEDNG